MILSPDHFISLQPGPSQKPRLASSQMLNCWMVEVYFAVSSPHHSYLHFYHLTFDDEVISRFLSITENSDPRDLGLINQLELIVVILISSLSPLTWSPIKQPALWIILQQLDGWKENSSAAHSLPIACSAQYRPHMWIPEWILGPPPGLVFNPELSEFISST